MSPEVLWPVLALIVAIGIAYGLFSYATRDRSKDKLTEAATRKQYETPTRDDVEEGTDSTRSG